MMSESVTEEGVPVHTAREASGKIRREAGEVIYRAPKLESRIPTVFDLRMMQLDIKKTDPTADKIEKLTSILTLAKTAQSSGSKDGELSTLISELEFELHTLKGKVPVVSADSGAEWETILEMMEGQAGFEANTKATESKTKPSLDLAKVYSNLDAFVPASTDPKAVEVLRDVAEILKSQDMSVADLRNTLAVLKNDFSKYNGELAAKSAEEEDLAKARKETFGQDVLRLLAVRRGE